MLRSQRRLKNQGEDEISTDEEQLSGGNMAPVVRIGNTVRRVAGPWTPTIHRFLRTLREAGVIEVPEPFGLDARGREVLSYREGEVATYPLPDWLWAPDLLRQAGELLRRVHDAGAGFDLTSAVWQLPAHEPPEVICLNDVAPYNMVFRDGRLAGLIDIDTASPGPRIWDLAYLAYRMVPYAEDAGDPFDAEARRQRLDQLIAAYGIPYPPEDVLGVAAERLLDLAAFTDGRAADTGRGEFLDHAAMYRRDAAALNRR